MCGESSPSVEQRHGFVSSHADLVMVDDELVNVIRSAAVEVSELYECLVVIRAIQGVLLRHVRYCVVGDVSYGY